MRLCGKYAQFAIRLVLPTAVEGRFVSGVKVMRKYGPVVKIITVSGGLAPYYLFIIGISITGPQENFGGSPSSGLVPPV